MVRELIIGSEENIIFIIIGDFESDSEADIFKTRFEFSIESGKDELLMQVLRNYDLSINVTKFSKSGKREFIFNSKDLIEYIDEILDGTNKYKVLPEDKQVIVKFISFLTRKKPTAFNFVRMKIKEEV